MIGDSRSIGSGQALKPSVTDAGWETGWQRSSGCLKQGRREPDGRERDKDTWQGTEQRRVYPLAREASVVQARLT